MKTGWTFQFNFVLPPPGDFCQIFRIHIHTLNLVVQIFFAVSCSILSVSCKIDVYASRNIMYHNGCGKPLTCIELNILSTNAVCYSGIPLEIAFKNIFGCYNDAWFCTLYHLENSEEKFQIFMVKWANTLYIDFSFAVGKRPVRFSIGLKLTEIVFCVCFFICWIHILFRVKVRLLSRMAHIIIAVIVRSK